MYSVCCFIYKQPHHGDVVCVDKQRYDWHVVCLVLPLGGGRSAVRPFLPYSGRSLLFPSKSYRRGRPGDCACVGGVPLAGAVFPGATAGHEPVT